MPHSQQTSNEIYIGIDWADQKHAVCLMTPDGQLEHATLKHTPEAITAWIDQLLERFPGCDLLVAVEQNRGSLAYALLASGSVRLYPINPVQSAKFRQTLFPSGRKSDQDDAELLLMFLKQFRDRVALWQPDDDLTRRIGLLSEQRRTLVNDRNRLVLRLQSLLKLYFPQALSLCGSTLYRDQPLKLLKRWPSLGELQGTHPKTLRAFLKDHGVSNKDQQTAWIESVRAAVPLTSDQAVIEPHSMMVQTLAQQIAELNKAIEAYDKALAQAVAEHPDNEIFRSLPGAGDALVPRMISAFGTDRDRYDSATSMQCKSGIAPVTKASGKSKVVQKRISCSKFLRQTFHEFANCSRQRSAWAQAFYDMKRKQGMKHQAAVRALAYKWIRIIYRLWQTGQHYDEARYQASLRTHNSPLLQFLESLEKTQPAT